MKKVTLVILLFLVLLTACAPATNGSCVYKSVGEIKTTVLSNDSYDIELTNGDLYNVSSFLMDSPKEKVTTGKLLYAGACGYQQRYKVK